MLPQVVRLVRLLMSADASSRPSAAAVLRSELLPPSVGDEQLADLLRSLPDNPAAYDRVLDALFAMQPAHAPAPEELPGAPVPLQVRGQMQPNLARWSVGSAESAHWTNLRCASSWDTIIIGCCC